MFFDSAAALRKTNAAVVLQQARERVARARKDQNDLAIALSELGLLELDFEHVTRAYTALEEARRLLEQDPTGRAHVLGAVWVGLAWIFLHVERENTREPTEFAGLRLSRDELSAKIVKTARNGLKILEENGYGRSAEAYRARILFVLRKLIALPLGKLIATKTPWRRSFPCERR